MAETLGGGRLEGKVALVTGAASGIGRAVARRFSEEGAVLVLGDIDVDGLESLAGTLPGDCTALRCDVTVEADVEALCAVALDHHGRLDIVVANAGRGAFSTIADHPLDTWREIIDLCLTGVFLTVKHAGRTMSDGGSVITIASLNAIQPAEGMAAYCAAKAGVAMFSSVAAMELGHRGIRVNTIAPGLVETNATAMFWQVPGVVEEFIENTTLGRVAQPEEVAAVAAFLASADAGYVSAGFFSVDGGASTKRYPDLPGALSRLTDADLS